MAHKVHPHGQSVVQPHQLHDHLAHQQPGGAKKGVAKLPDAQRENWMTEHPYPESAGNAVHPEVENE